MNRRFLLVLLIGAGCIVGAIAWRWCPIATAEEKSAQSVAERAAVVRASGTSAANIPGKAPKIEVAGKTQGSGIPVKKESLADLQPLESASDKAETRNAFLNTAQSQQTSQVRTLRAVVERGTALFFDVAKVDDTTRDRLIAIEVDNLQENKDLMHVGRAQGLSIEEVGKLRDIANNRYRDQITEVLGPEQGAYFVALNNSSQFAPIAEDFAARCAAQGEPLVPAAIAAVRINLSENLRNPAFPRSPVLTTDGIPWEQDQAFKAAAKVLTPGQLQAFKQLWSEHPYPKIGDMPSR